MASVLFIGGLADGRLDEVLYPYRKIIVTRSPSFRPEPMNGSIPPDLAHERHVYVPIITSENGGIVVHESLSADEALRRLADAYRNAGRRG